MEVCILKILKSDFYDLVFQKSALALERERVLEIAQFVKSNKTLKMLFNGHPYNEILYSHLSRYKPGIKLL